MAHDAATFTRGRTKDRREYREAGEVWVSDYGPYLVLRVERDARGRLLDMLVRDLGGLYAGSLRCHGTELDYRQVYRHRRIGRLSR